MAPTLSCFVRSTSAPSIHFPTMHSVPWPPRRLCKSIGVDDPVATGKAYGCARSSREVSVAALWIDGLVTRLIGPVSFDIAAGECLALMGASGAGKSLLLRAIVDLDPNTGNVWVSEERFLHALNYVAARGLALGPQRVRELLLGRLRSAAQDASIRGPTHQASPRAHPGLARGPGGHRRHRPPGRHGRFHQNSRTCHLRTATRIRIHRGGGNLFWNPRLDELRPQRDGISLASRSCSRRMVGPAHKRTFPLPAGHGESVPSIDVSKPAATPRLLRHARGRQLPISLCARWSLR
jgi:energy-coupling factor transporter ATP-binding protein EcfA2